MMRSVKILSVLFIISIPPLVGFAQQFNYTAKLSPVDSTGFYSIVISPQLSSYIKTDFADIRITDDKKQWVPHILQTGRAVFMENLFTAFPILQNTITDSGKNILIIENNKTDGIYNLKLFLKNSAVSRNAFLSGSNNQRDWYIIDDNITIGRSNETAKDEYLQEINFPLSKYRYLKVIIDNENNDPLLITKAGFYAQPVYNKLTNYQDNPTPLFTQKDSNNYSYIKVVQNNNYHFDRITLSVSGAKYYSREMRICFPDFGKNNIPIPGTTMGNFNLLSALPSILEVPATKTALFFIVIKNADNPPLKIEKVLTHQETVSLVTYLEHGRAYHLLLGDSLATFADYDLQNFKDSITNLHPLNYGHVYAVKKNMLKNKAGNQQWWIWPSIILAVVMLSFLTYRLTGDINKSNK